MFVDKEYHSEKLQQGMTVQLVLVVVAIVSSQDAGVRLPGVLASGTSTWVTCLILFLILPQCLSHLLSGSGLRAPASRVCRSRTVLSVM